METKELSRIVMSLASLAIAVPSPIDNPTCAAFSAGASLVPSPVAATTSPCPCSRPMSRALSIGRARYIIRSFGRRGINSASGVTSNSAPLMAASSPQVSSHSPICRAISRVVSRVSPVTILTATPAFRHSAMAAGTSGRTGSLIATRARNVRESAAIRPSANGWAFCGSER